MRTPMTRVVGTLAIAGSVFMTAGCLGNSSDGANANGSSSSSSSNGFGGSGNNTGNLADFGNSEACKTMLGELQNLSSRAVQSASDPAGMADIYTQSASKIRSAAAQADGDAKAAGEELATAIDQLGSMLKDASNGGSIQMPNTSNMTTAGGKLGRACAS